MVNLSAQRYIPDVDDVEDVELLKIGEVNFVYWLIVFWLCTCMGT